MVFKLLRRVRFLALVLITWTTYAMAQAYHDRNNTAILPSVTIPYPAIPVAGAQYTVGPTAATALTVPATAQFAIACGSVAVIRYTTSGTTPTSTVGLQIAVGSCIQLSVAQMAAFQAISATGKLDVEYFK